MFECESVGWRPRKVAMPSGPVPIVSIRTMAAGPVRMLNWASSDDGVLTASAERRRPVAHALFTAKQEVES